MRKRSLSKKDRRHHDEESDHRWIITYADFVTLLFGFFLMLYATSAVQVTELQDALSKSKEDVAKANRLLALSVSEVPQHKSSGGDNPVFTKLAEQLQAGNSDIMRVQNNQDWVSIELKSSSLFGIGSAMPTPETRALLQKIVPSLRQFTSKIVVEGHTDNQPILSEQFASNWELSAARAATVARVMMELGISKTRLSAIGYSDMFPLQSNSSPEGRAQNRRVVILMMKK